MAEWKDTSPYSDAGWNKAQVQNENNHLRQKADLTS